MKGPLLGLIATLLFHALGFGQTLDELRVDFDTKTKELSQFRDKEIDVLSDRYTGALEGLIEKTKATGNLDAVIPVRDEIEAVKAGDWPLKDLGKNASSQLKELRRTYVAERGKLAGRHAASLTKLVDTMLARLKKEETELTKAGDLDGAMAARKMGEALNSDPSIAAARTAAGGRGGAVATPAENSLEELLKSRTWVYKSGDDACRWSFLDQNKVKSDGWSKPTRWDVKDNRYLTVGYGDGNSCVFDFQDLSKLEALGKTNKGSARSLSAVSKGKSR